MGQKQAQLINADCLEAMKLLPDGSVDLILCDLPYGTTQNQWDSPIPLQQLWEAYWRLCKPSAAIVLTSAMPFTASLVQSQLSAFKYDWVWQKEPTGHLNAKKQPMRSHESILVFSRGTPPYHPQGLKPCERRRGEAEQTRSGNYGISKGVYTQDMTGYPTSVQSFPKGKGTIHPTQKPVALIEYLIRTYTNEGELVLDNCAGSFTTGIACLNTGRRFIGIEKDPEYYRIGVERMSKHPAFSGEKAIALSMPIL